MARPHSVLILLIASMLATGVLAGQTDHDLKIREHVRAGLEARRENRLDAAAAEFEAIIRLAPDFAEAYMNLGLVRHQQGKLHTAIGAFQKALQLKPDLKGVNAVLGLDLLIVGRLKEAVASLETEFKSDPSNMDVNSWLGLAYLESGQHRKAIERLEMARQSRPQDPDILFYLARAHMEASGELYDELFRVAPDSARTRQAVALTYGLAARTDEAINEYQQVLSLNPGLPGIRESMGDLYLATSDYVSAEEVLRAELEMRPDKASVLYKYGTALLNLGRSSEALSHLQRAVTLDPELAEAHHVLGKAFWDEGNLEGAEKAWLKATQLATSLETAAATYYQLAQLYRKQGNQEQADQALTTFNKLQEQLKQKKGKQP